ncbi:LacI family DNA-binding transcriptional regulator [Marisediminicola senii]|uniref:LacI family DNA-binding transcriptional regulator n=1 Tax=Marisediminicola senii TaxID=2711233 RepID=UPI0013EC606C|nr:LacI family DNA-binding transcriptional regulator [Marisediminicola senii]
MTIDQARRAAPTLEAVAAAAGVSRSTVSRVVNGGAQVKPDVVASVNAAIESLGYIPNRAARSLARRRSMAIALVVPEETTRFFGDPYFAEIVRGITTALDDSEYVLVLQLASASGPSANSIRYLLGGNVDGALVVSHHSSDTSLTRLGASLPVVFNGRPLAPTDPPSYFVDVDNAAGAEAATDHLISLGRRRIAIIAGPEDMPPGIDRTTGWRRALQRASLTTDLIVHGDFSQAGGATAMRQLLAADPSIDGVFAASDLMASGAMSVLRDRGIGIPHEVAVVGFDDSRAATSGSIQLTTVHQPSALAGETMAKMLIALLRGEQVEHERILPTRLVVRDSA